MAECIECGSAVVPGESFCSNCGTKNPASAPGSVPASPKESNESPATDESNQIGGSDVGATAAVSLAPSDSDNSAEEEDQVGTGLGSESLGGASTGEVKVQAKHTVKKGTTGGHQPTIKQLDPGSVLNARYEIVRRIGGGGMGAVYLAKDRNLGDAPRAVKEMVEAHLDPALHEKSIADFKREAVLLTALEHPSIPTIYDYFYDETLGRFYLVMRFIAGGDLASRLRSAPGGRIDEKTVADWGRP